MEMKELLAAIAANPAILSKVAEAASSETDETPVTPVKAKGKAPVPKVKSLNFAKVLAESQNRPKQGASRDLTGSVSTSLPSGRSVTIAWDQFTGRQGDVITSIQFGGFVRRMNGKVVPLSFMPEQLADLYCDEMVEAVQRFMQGK